MRRRKRCSLSVKNANIYIARPLKLTNKQHFYFSLVGCVEWVTFFNVLLFEC